MNNKVAVVTGGRRGIGRGIAFALAEAGYRIVVIDLVDDEETSATLHGIAQRGRSAAFVAADIAAAEHAESVCSAANDAFGRVDVLVSNAGVMVKDRSVDVLHTSIESFDRLMQVNLRGTFFLMQAFARRMAAEPPAQNYRALITISSSNASMAKTTAGEYCISKAGLSMVNRILALKLAPHGIGCFEVRPGLIKTEMNAALHATYDPILTRGLSPIPRWGTARDVGATVATLANGTLAFSTGEIIHVDGGLHVPRSPFESPFVRDRLAT